MLHHVTLCLHWHWCICFLFKLTLVLFLLLHLLHFWCGWWLLSVGSSLREQPGPGPTTVGRLSPHFPSHTAPYGGMRAISPLPKWARGILSDFVMTSLEFIDKKKMLLNGIRWQNMFSIKVLISLKNVVPSALFMAIHQDKFVGLNMVLLSYKAMASRKLLCFNLQSNTEALKF